MVIHEYWFNIKPFETSPCLCYFQFPIKYHWLCELVRLVRYWCHLMQVKVTKGKIVALWTPPYEGVLGECRYSSTHS